MVEYLQNNWAEISGIAAIVVVLASRIARLTPNQTDNKIVATIRKFFRVMGLDIRDKE